MKAKCIDKNISEPYGDFILGKQYEIIEISEVGYCVIDEVKDRNYVDKKSFKIVHNMYIE
ncbi:hypothetical protein FDB42_12040 [Clostridium botulinum]|nr:hypothetical protein [Clostridium botulinum]